MGITDNKIIYSVKLLVPIQFPLKKDAKEAKERQRHMITVNIKSC